MYRFLAIALVFFGTALPNCNAEDLGGEVTVIELKDGSSVTIQQAQTREIAGRSFVGGKVLSSSSKSDSPNVVGSRIWLAGTEILRVIEFDTKEQFSGKRTTVEPGKPATVEPGSEVTRIQAMNGRVTRDNSQPNGPVISVDLSDCADLKDDDLRLLSSFSELKELHLHGTRISDEAMKHIAGLTNLTYLGMIGATNVTDVGMKELVGLQKLEEVRFGHLPITDACVKDLAQLKSLKMAGLIGTRITADGLKELCEALPDLRHNREGPGGIDEGGGGGGGGQRTDPNFDVSIAVPAYVDRHPSVLFDEAHQNFHTASGRYKVLADLMTNDGYRVTPNTNTLTADLLANHNILIIANASTNSGIVKSAFTNAECDCIQNWVNEGGSLLLITDHEPFGSASEELGKRFGVRMSLQVAGDPAHETNNGLEFTRDARQIGNHPIMMGRDESERVNRVLTFTGQSLKGPAGSAALLKFADTATHHFDEQTAAGRNQGLALNFGKGRVVVMGEAAQLSAQVYGNPPEPMGMNVQGCDNRKMALNIMHWLSGLIAAADSPSNSNLADAEAPAVIEAAREVVTPEVATPIAKTESNNAPADESKSILEKLQGEWATVKLEEGGKEHTEADVQARNHRLTFSDGKCIQSFTNPRDIKVTVDSAMKIDTTKSPFEMDWFDMFQTTAERPQREAIPVKVMAIFELDGDTLRIHFRGHRDGKDFKGNPVQRPTEFKATQADANGDVLITLQRVKP